MSKQPKTEAPDFALIQNTPESNTQSRQRRRLSEPDPIFSIEEPANDNTNDALTLMEEIMILSLDTQSTASKFLSLTDSIPHVLRCCVLIELCLRGFIGVKEETNREALKCPIIILSNNTSTGDTFLDEALSSIRTEPKYPLQKWIDILTGEVWNRQLAKFQMYQLRERLCKSLLEKGLVRAETSSTFGILATISYPLRNAQLKRKLGFQIIDTALSANRDLKSLLKLMAVKAAGLLDSALNVTDAPTASSVRAAIKELQSKQSYSQLQAQYNLQASPSQLFLLSGILEYFTKINSLF